MTPTTDPPPTPAPDRFASARLVADTVLYEGYVLYPYRASAQKNQLRWQFGVLAPPDVARSSGSERWSMRSEVIVEPGEHPLLSVRIRCLQVQHRDVERSIDGGSTFETVDSVVLDGRTVVAWDEALDREIDLAPVGLLPVADATSQHAFRLSAGEETEALRDHRGDVVGRMIRRRQEVAGLVRISTEQVDDGPLLKVSIVVENATAWPDGDEGTDRDTVMRSSLIAVHTLLAVDDGSFISLLEPPAYAEAAVAGCTSEGTFPVLIGDSVSSDVMLSSPIILYDFPAIAPESTGDFCDSTEIDEILALRVMTLTDAEKAEARGTDARAAAIIDRCDDMPDEIWSRLHGAVRSLRPIKDAPTDDIPMFFEPRGDEPTDAVSPQQQPWWDPGQDASFDPFTDTMWIGGVEVGSGTHVRLRPSRRADAHDLFYAGQLATVKGVFNDVDGDQHVAVALDDDPASDMFEWQGRFLYFHPDEIEVLEQPRRSRVLVAGIGNIFLGDDGFGVEVIKHIGATASDAGLHDGVTVADFGIRGVHLAFELLEGYDVLVLIDAIPLGEAPGTVVTFEPDVESIDPSTADAHSMSPAVVLGLLAGMGGELPHVIIVGCQPLTLEEGIGLSQPVSDAIAPAVKAVHRVLDDIFSPAQKELQP
ncbi:MAG: hydrogenase maturation protease [Ilumatobacteraceae bacterium]